MKDIPNGVVDMMFADLPYGTTKNKWDSHIDLESFWQEVHRVCKFNAAMICTAQVPFNIILGNSNFGNLKYEWIYKKNLPTGHLNANKMPLKAHENVMVFYRQPPYFNPIKTTGHKRKVATHKAQSGNYNLFESHHYDSTERYPISVQEFPGDKRTTLLNRTQKPIILVEYMIKTYSKPGELILDPCAGSGTTAVAAINTGRRYICIEKDEEQYSKIKNRLNGN